MKVFDLSCANGHGFEGWFGSESDFEAQLKSKQLVCPLCADGHIERRPSAPRLNLNAGADRCAQNQQETSEEPNAPKELAAMAPGQQELQKAVLGMVRKLVKGTEDVGEDFAEEARRIHYGEAPERGIRGVVSKEEAKELIDEGVSIMPLPWPDTLKETLQ